MTFANLGNAAQETAKLPREPRPAGFHPTSRLTPIFSGPNGLRAGWRLLIFLALLGVPAAGLFALAHAYGGQPQQVTLTPILMAVNEALVLLILCIATWIMGRIEHRKFTEYGLPRVRRWEKISGLDRYWAFWPSMARC